MALAAGLMTSTAGFDTRCPSPNPDMTVADFIHFDVPVAAVINWFGITDVEDLINGPEPKTYAITWLGAQADRDELAKRVSPIHHIKRDRPLPVITIHGDEDLIVPYRHATELHKRLQRTKTPNKLVTIEGGGHGGFALQAHQNAMREIQAFLREQGVLTRE